MGLFDKMFGSGANQAQDANSQRRFQELKQKYEPVLRTIDQQQIQLQNLHVQDNKLFLRGTAPSEQAKNNVWNQIKSVNPQYDDITADITVAQPSAQAQSAAAGAGSSQTTSGGGRIESYVVREGDTLSKISQRFYGDAHEFMRIFYANRDKLNDPDKIKAGETLKVPV